MAEKSEKSDYQDLLEELDAYLSWPEGSPAVYNYYESYIALETRDELSKYRLTDELIELDKQIIRGLKKYTAEVNRKYVDDDPLEKWWWHLDKIQNGTYPPELLPDYLQVEYFKLHPHLKRP
ncbi:hypothetical protein FHQ18_11735 [Deferribacter autotrophicus]|uniref:Uncharacterized protein n=1 Tax=Deferribacter autotrophicus TaxID=500465 RepID=A0A5A8F1T3_9BACT|nr:hypothetical protein [Deferribacter autotrophicus]KAA0257229.1 hypothetical protein FHQ18_11735 [Deferribacter autotrophicus]